MSEKSCIIYAAVNLSDLEGKKIYVGLTEKELSERKYRHEYVAKRGSKLHFHRAIMKNKDKFAWLIVGRSSDYFSGLEMERVLIKFYKDLGFKLYNHTEGGGGVKGFKLSVESREKMSAKKIGKTPGWAIGPNRDEIAKKLSLKNKGLKRPPTSENRAKLVAKAVKMGSANGKPLRCNFDGRIFRSAVAAEKYYGIRSRYISWCCLSGKSKFGLTFSRISLEDYPL